MAKTPQLSFFTNKILLLSTSVSNRRNKKVHKNLFQPISFNLYPCVCLTNISICFNRNAFSRKHSTVPRCESSGMEISASLTAMIAATGGILHSMERNVLVREPLMVLFTCRQVLNGERIHTDHATSKESARSSTRGRYAWDSGWVNVLHENLVTPTRVGTQCPGCTWKKYLLRRPKIKDHAGRPPSYYFFKGCFKVLNE